MARPSSVRGVSDSPVRIRRPHSPRHAPPERLVVDALEAFEPADLTLVDFPLLKKPYGVVRDFLRGLDPNLEIDDDGAKSSRLGVALYDPSAGEEPERTLSALSPSMPTRRAEVRLRALSRRQ